MGSDWREVERVQAENNALRHQLSMIEIKRYDDKLAESLALVKVQEARQEAERATEQLRIREECRRGCILQSEIVSHGSEMSNELVFDPVRLARAVDVIAADLTYWPGGADQEREQSVNWEHVAAPADRHSSLGPEDLSPLELKLKALLQ
jgi:hypothetical protein